MFAMVPLEVKAPTIIKKIATRFGMWEGTINGW
jgi:hypothetical protein